MEKKLLEVSGLLENNSYGFSLDQGVESEYFSKFMLPFVGKKIKLTVEEVEEEV